MTYDDVTRRIEMLGETIDNLAKTASSCTIPYARDELLKQVAELVRAMVALAKGQT